MIKKGHRCQGFHSQTLAMLVVCVGGLATVVCADAKVASPGRGQAGGATDQGAQPRLTCLRKNQNEFWLRLSYRAGEWTCRNGVCVCV